MKRPVVQLNDKTIFIMGAVTLYAYPLIGYILLTIFAPHVDVYSMVYAGSPFIWQIIHGLIFGSAAFLVINMFIQTKLLAEFSEPIFKLGKKMNWIQIFFLSFAAGVGEELLFRVAIQHFFGLWPTAVLFVAIHGYLNLNDWKIFTYGLFMTVVSGGFGILYLKYGIASSMSAHFIIDFLILGLIKCTPIDKLLLTSKN